MRTTYLNRIIISFALGAIGALVGWVLTQSGDMTLVGATFGVALGSIITVVEDNPKS